MTDLHDVIDRLGAEERAVMLHIAKRLLAGQASYGLLDVANDQRDFDAEAGDELSDLLAYLACSWLRRDIARRQNASQRRVRGFECGAQRDG